MKIHSATHEASADGGLLVRLRHSGDPERRRQQSSARRGCG
jgi:hypothetical protein